MRLPPRKRGQAAKKAEKAAKNELMRQVSEKQAREESAERGKTVDKIVEMLRKGGGTLAFLKIIFVENVHFNFELEVLL